MALCVCVKVKYIGKNNMKILGREKEWPRGDAPRNSFSGHALQTFGQCWKYLSVFI